MDLAARNPIYAIVALAFITPAEKILRKFFGFEKASTAGTLGAFASMAGGAAAYKMLSNAVNRHGGKGGKGGKSGNNIRTQNNKQLEDPNAPSGVDGFTGHNSGGSSNNNNRNNNALEDGEATAQQRMLDAYDEGIGTDEWDAQERDAMTKEAYEQTGMNYSAEEYAQLLRDTGYEEDEIGSMLVDAGYGNNNETQNQGNSDTGNNANRSFGAKVGAGFAGSGKAIKNKVSTTLGNKAWRRQRYKEVVHLAARGYATVGIGALGLAAGISGDNLEDVPTYGIGGATLGATVGGNILANTADRIGSGVANSVPVQGFVNGYTGTTSLERQVAKQEKALQADTAFMQQVNEQYADGTLGGKELKEATARAAKLVSYGVNTEKLGKTMKVEDSIMADLANSQMNEEEKRQLAREQAATAAKMAEKIKNPEALVGKKGEEIQARWAEQIKNKNTSLSDNEAKKNAQEMMKRVRKIKGV